MIEALEADLREDRKILRVKAELVKILKGLPDDDARRRVLMATAAFYDIRLD